MEIVITIMGIGLICLRLL